MDILNLKSFNVLMSEETEYDYHIKAKTTHKPQICPHCHSHNIVGFGSKERLVRDLPVHAKRVGIYVNSSRFKCKSCNKTFIERLPDVDGKRNMTNRLVSWVGKESIRRTFISIADDIGVTENTVKSVFTDFVSSLESQIKFETPQWLGMDEIYLIKPRGVIANVQDNTMIDLLINRNKETIIHYLSNLKGKEQVIKVVSIP